MRRRVKWDVLKPSTEWCWPGGPQEVRLPGGSLDALARALVAGDSGALLIYRRWGYALRWEDRPPGRENEDAARAIRRYKLAYRHQDRAGMGTADETTPPGPFVRAAALCREDRGADVADVDRTNMRDAIWRLLDEAGAALDEIG
jgi:hypothetical protein